MGDLLQGVHRPVNQKTGSINVDSINWSNGVLTEFSIPEMVPLCLVPCEIQASLISMGYMC